MTMTTNARGISLKDERDIAYLMTGWIHRDVGEWDELRGLFHPDAQIVLSRFVGPASKFVEGSVRMSRSAFRTKHVIAAPSIRFSSSGLRAVAETNAMVVGENRHMLLGTVTHNRFIDRVEHRDGRWAIAHQASVYDFSSFTFPVGPSVPIDRGAVSRFPTEYAALAYLLEASGFPVGDTFAVKGSDRERAIKDDALAWLERSS